MLSSSPPLRFHPQQSSFFSSSWSFLNKRTSSCRSSIPLGQLLLPFFSPLVLNTELFRRKDSNRAPRAPKRSPTPTSATFPPDGMNPPPVPPSPSTTISKPLYLCSPFAEAALVKGNFKTIVMLPKYVDVMEWVAVNSMSLNYCAETPLLIYTTS